MKLNKVFTSLKSQIILLIPFFLLGCSETTFLINSAKRIGTWGSTWAAPIAGLMIQKYTNSKVNLELEKFIINGNTVNLK